MEEESLDRAPIKMPKKALKVRSKAPAPVQISAEQLLREAKERELEIVPPPPRQKISDPEELKEYQMKRRKEYEDAIRKNRMNITNYIKYAKWEESLGEMQRGRSVFERGLDMDHRNVSLWLQYAEMEMRNRQVNHARNVFDRAVTILPRVTQFWLKFTYMEEMLGNIPGARVVFERWMEWEPSQQAWQTYINFELRYKEIERARNIWQRYLHVHHEVENWIRYAKFEDRHGNVQGARQVYERGVEFFGEDNMEERLLVAFSRFEENQKEHERARVIYRYALDTLPKEKRHEIFKHYSVHEKKYGERPGIENVVVSKRKHQYEELISTNPLNYDAWFDYLRLLENEGAEVEMVRDLYERAIANVPPQLEKRYWRRYIYLWINYALYEELIAKDYDKAREVYKACLDNTPLKKFSFSKVWLLFAHFEIRQKNLTVARKILGNAIGRCSKDKIFRGYIDLELQLREFDRCRVLYEKFLQFGPENCTTWIKFAELETLLGDVERARAIYELAIGQALLDMPEVLWKAYIDFETGQEEWNKARALYKRLLSRTQHLKVWISYARFELATGEAECVQCARNVYKQANISLANSDKEERLMLLEAWKQFELDYGNTETQTQVGKEMPRRVKKRRPLKNADGSEAGWEEFYDYIFPADETSHANLKLLAMAKMWKKKQADEPENTDTTADKQREGDSDTDLEESSDDENAP